jgi:hypothetical protein
MTTPKKEKTPKVSAAVMELQRRANSINILLKNIGEASGKVSSSLQGLLQLTAALDKELSTAITSITIMDSSSPGIMELRQLRALNNANLKNVNGVSSVVSRMRNTKANSLIVS